MTVRKHARGFTILELLVVMGISSIIMVIPIYNLGALVSPLQSGSAQALSFLKQTRARALSTTSAYRITPASDTRLEVSFAANCTSATFTADSTLSLDLPAGATLQDTSWDLCFSSRGMADQNLEFDIGDADGQAKTIEVLLGGSSRIVE